MSDYLKELSGKRVRVVTNDGKTYTGLLKGFDKSTNIILEDTDELVFSSDMACECIPLGLFLIKGDSLAVIGQEDASKPLNLETTRGAPLPPIHH